MDEFDRYRAAMNEKLLGSDHLGIKRFFALDCWAWWRPQCFVVTTASLITSNSARALALRVQSS
jgi:hypothetical protein